MRRPAVDVLARFQLHEGMHRRVASAAMRLPSGRSSGPVGIAKVVPVSATCSCTFSLRYRISRSAGATQQRPQAQLCNTSCRTAAMCPSSWQKRCSDPLQVSELHTTLGTTLFTVDFATPRQVWRQSNGLQGEGGVGTLPRAFPVPGLHEGLRIASGPSHHSGKIFSIREALSVRALRLTVSNN